MHYLTEEDRVFVRKLKKIGILRMFTKADMENVTRNGGVLITCSDGNVDISQYYRKAISRRNHEIKLFGGSLTLCPQLPTYDSEEERVLIKNIQKGFGVKDTSTLSFGHHYPCGVAMGYSIKQVLYFNYLVSRRMCVDLLPEVNKGLPEELHLREERVFDFFHVKRINKKKEVEQNMYLFDTSLYAEYYAMPNSMLLR